MSNPSQRPQRVASKEQRRKKNAKTKRFGPGR